MAFTFNLAPPRVGVPERDWSFMDTIMQRREDRKAGDAVQQFAGGLPPEDAARYAPLLQNPQTRDMALKEIMARGRPKELPNSVQEYQYGQQDPGFAQHQLNLKRAGGTNVNVGGYEKQYDKTLAEGYAKTFLGTQDNARTSQKALNSLQAMENLMSQPGFYSGTGGESVMALKRLGASMGMNVDGVDSIESFSALAKQAALDAMGGSLGTGFSNADRDFVIDQVPGLQNTPEGNKSLIGIQRKIQNRNIEIAGLARDYAARNGGVIDAQFDTYLADWAEKNPLFPSKPKGGEEQSGPVRVSTPQEFEALPSGSRFIAPDGSVRTKP